MARLRIERILAGAFAALVALSLPAMAQNAPGAAPIIDKPFAEHHLAIQIVRQGSGQGSADAQRRL